MIPLMISIRLKSFSSEGAQRKSSGNGGVLKLADLQFVAV